MKTARVKDLINRVIAVAFTRSTVALKRRLDKLSKMSVEEIEELTRSDEGIRQVVGPFGGRPAKQVCMPEFSEVVVAVPGPMTDAELEKVLSGGSRHEWGPWRRMAKRAMARPRLK
ncbi:MAG TPA: hypothetical protein VJM31_08930 [Vicinamibacterales bacterium]|nr:hypothetical protein [Vicinamibacterales bacterium]